MDNYITISEAAERAHVSTRLIQRLISDGHITAVKFGRCTRISEDSISDYVERQTIRPASRSETPVLRYKPGMKLV